MITRARIGDGPVSTNHSVLNKPPDGELSIPVHYRTLEDAEGIALGYRQHMFDLKDKNGHGGSVSTGAGWGTDAIILDWNGQSCVIRGLDLLEQWVRTFDPKEADRFPKDIS